MTTKKLKALPAAILGLCYAGSLSAAPVLEEVVVTAQKKSENLQDVPIAVAALQGQELVDAGIDTQRSLSMMTPNVTVNVNASFIAPYIRGVGTQYANPGLEPSVATYFNDLYISRPSAGFMSFNDVERVEVLKGPQGTLYGRNTTGGAIRVITKAPTDEFDAGVGVGIGNYNQRKLDGFVSGPITENVKGRFAAQMEERDGYIKNRSGGDDMENRDTYFLHGKLHWDTSDRMSVKLAADYSEKNDHEGQTFQPLYRSAPTQSGLAVGGQAAFGHDEYRGTVASQKGKDEFEFTAGGVQLRIDYDFEAFTFTSITGYRLTEFSGPADLDATDANLITALTGLDKTEDYSQEFQLLSNGEGPLDWVVGLYYFVEEATDDFYLSGLFIDAQTTIPNSAIGGEGDIEIDSIAPYGQVSYELNESWEVLFGGRFVDETKEVKNNFVVGTVGGDYRPVKPYLQVVPVPDDEVSFTEFTPKAQLTWRPNDGVMLYLAYQEGLKSGGFNMPSPSPNAVTAVESEFIESFELGWKTEFDRVRLNGALFHYDLKDLQLQVTDQGGGITSVRNAGDATVDGIEADVTFAATERLVLGAGFGWQKAEFGDVPNGIILVPCSEAPTNSGCVAQGGLGLATITGNIKGNDLPHAPELTGYLRAGYELPLGDNGNVNFNLLASYSDAFYYTADNNFEEPEKWLANANVTWNSADERYAVSGYITNLTDEEYNTHAAPFAGTGGWTVPGQPRLFGVRVSMRY